MNELDKLRALPGERRSQPGTAQRAVAREVAPAPAPRPEPTRNDRPRSGRPGAGKALVAAPRLQALTPQLVTQVLDHLELAYEFDEDGDILGIWDNGYFFAFILSADPDDYVFQLHARWEESVEAHQYGEAAIFANEWNSEQGTPTAYAREESEDGVIGIYGETTVSFGPGVAVEQLVRVIEDAVGSSLALFDSAAQMFAPAEIDVQDPILED